MLLIDNLVVPHDGWWLSVMEGMRNPFKTTRASDSFYCYGDVFSDMTQQDCTYCPYSTVETESFESMPERFCHFDNQGWSTPVLGEKDYNLLMSLCKKGSSHRKVLRQLPVLISIKAPLYFWRELDQYKIGTTTSSESTMHTLMRREFTTGDFSLDHLYPEEQEEYVNTCNAMRARYKQMLEEGLPTENTWFQLIETMPQSYMQKRTWTANYETLVNIIEQRAGHKLPEWREFILTCLSEVLYLKDIVLACGALIPGIEEKDGKARVTLNYDNPETGKWERFCYIDEIQ